MKTPELPQGTALILAGPQGCGKTILANKIAEQYGRVQECELRQLASSRDLNMLLLGRPDALIVEGLPSRPDMWADVKKLITGRKTPVTSYGRVAVVTNPRLIFCTNEEVPDGLRASRYFQVVDMEARAAA